MNQQISKMGSNQQTVIAASTQAALVQQPQADVPNEIKNMPKTDIKVSNCELVIVAGTPPPYYIIDTSTTNLTGKNNENKEFKMYKRRWIGMLAIICLNLATGLVWLTFNAVSKISENWFNASLTEVNLTVILYFIGYIVMSSFSGYVFEKFGIKKALIIGGVLNLIGTWIRYFGSFIDSSSDNPAPRVIVVLLGQFIAATGQPFFLNAPPKFSAVWFDDSSRTVATTIGSVSNPVGAALAMVLIPAICAKDNGDDMPFTLLVVGIISIVALIPAILMPALPPTPPSASAEIALAEAADESFISAIKKVSSNRQFWILFTAFAVFVGFFNATSSLINQIVEPYGYTDDDAGLFGACLIGAGIVGAGIAGAFVDKTKKHKLVLRLATPFLAAGYVAFIFVVQKESFGWICTVCGVLGFFSFGLLPVALELGIECTYPAPPSTSTSILWMGGQTLAVIFLVVGDAMRDLSPYSDEPKDTLRTGTICVAAVACVIAACSFTFNSPYYRMEAEKARNAVINSNDNANATVQVESTGVHSEN